MTYERAHSLKHLQKLDRAVVSHSAELVRGEFGVRSMKAPLIRPLGALLPKGRKVLAAPAESPTKGRQ